MIVKGTRYVTPLEPPWNDASKTLLLTQSTHDFKESSQKQQQGKNKTEKIGFLGRKSVQDLSVYNVKLDWHKSNLNKSKSRANQLKEIKTSPVIKEEEESKILEKSKIESRLDNQQTNSSLITSKIKLKSPTAEDSTPFGKKLKLISQLYNNSVLTTTHAKNFENLLTPSSSAKAKSNKLILTL